MEIIYTEITQDLTAELLNIAKEELAKGKKIYYIVPSSLSFKKERELLERLSPHRDNALFDLIVTRFKQLPYYFNQKEESSNKVELSQSGLTMLFRRVLKNFDKNTLPLYYSLQDSQGFLDALVELRNELIESKLTSDDLPNNEKNKELKLILDTFEEELNQHYANYSEINQLIENIQSDKFTVSLKNTVIIIDGYSRFTAEDESIIFALQNKVSRLIIGTYTSDNELKHGNFSVYSQSNQMILDYRKKFQAQSKYVSNEDVNKIYTKLTKIIEKENNFTLSNAQKLNLSAEDDQYFQIWESENDTVEIEKLAKKIRQEISNGKKFKEFTILVGDKEKYQIPIQEIFSLYDIPFFYAIEESMSNHPLVIFLESLYAIKKNNYRKDDVINLIKSQMYNKINIEQGDIDYFEYYLSQENIQGKKRYTHIFEDEQAEKLRQIYFGQEGLQSFLSIQSEKTGKEWIISLQNLLQDGKVNEKLNDLFQGAEEKKHHQEADKHTQIWKLLLSTFEEFLAVFENEKLKSVDFLEILLSGIKSANYRQIPSNVDVINVEAYELIEPRSNKYVYAIGLNSSNFPKIKKNISLISDEERVEININTPDDKFIEELNIVGFKKSAFTSISLMNAATEKLVISAPQIYDNSQDDISPIIQTLLNHSDAHILKKIESDLSENLIDNVGNKRAMIAQLCKIERQLANKNSSETVSSFFGSLYRILSKTDSDFEDLIADLDQDITPSSLSFDTINQVYNQELVASVSAFEQFYRCEYKYFLEKTLGLQAFEKLDIDSRTVGNFFHEVFEKLLSQSDLSDLNFDDQLTKSIQDVSKKYEKIFTRDATSQFTWLNLNEIARQTAAVLRLSFDNENIKILETEKEFKFEQGQLTDMALRGKIDRVDQLFTHSIGAIDYKSSAHEFNLQDAYDGISLQFLTYLDALRKNNPQSQLWGALYLHIQNKILKLSKIDHLSELDHLLKKEMQYTGLINEEYSEQIKKEIDFVNVNKNKIYSQEEISCLIEWNEQHYEKAGQRLQTGNISINPIREQGKNTVKGCEYCPFKSICRFEASSHMNNYARVVGSKSTAEIQEELKGGR